MIIRYKLSQEFISDAASAFIDLKKLYIIFLTSTQCSYSSETRILRVVSSIVDERHHSLIGTLILLLFILLFLYFLSCLDMTIFNHLRLSVSYVHKELKSRNMIKYVNETRLEVSWFCKRIVLVPCSYVLGLRIIFCCGKSPFWRDTNSWNRELYALGREIFNFDA